MARCKCILLLGSQIIYTLIDCKHNKIIREQRPRKHHDYPNIYKLRQTQEIYHREYKEEEEEKSERKKKGKKGETMQHCLSNILFCLFVPMIQ